MKKTIVTILSSVSFLMSSVVFSANNNLCIALLNLGSAPVKFTTAVDPGYEPVVKPNENVTLPGDFMVGCYSDRCTIYVIPPDYNYTQIKDVPIGSQIIYYGPQHYILDTHAKIQCP